MGETLIVNLKHANTEGCNIYKNFIRRKNGTFMGLTGFEGIPQNFLLNLITWIVFVLLFVFLRKKIYNYGRVALMKKEEMKWTDMFYEPDELTLDTKCSNYARIPVISESVHPGHSYLDENFSPDVKDSGLMAISQTYYNTDEQGQPLKEALFTQSAIENLVVSGSLGLHEKMSGADNEIFDEIDLHDEQDDIYHHRHKRTIEHTEIKDTGYFTWIKILYKLTDEQYKEKCGVDSLFYISFQRHLIAISAFMMITSLSIILPINLHKSFVHENDTSHIEFFDTSIANLEKEHHKFIWAHVLLAVSYLLVSVLIMRRFSRQLQTTKRKKDISNTIIIVGIPKDGCREDLIKAHFAECYPEANITETSFAYKVTKAQAADHKRLRARSAKLYCIERLQKTGKRPKMRAYLCGACNCHCCGACKETDAIQYYSNQERKYVEELEKQRRLALENPLGIVFITFSTEGMAERIVDDYAWTFNACLLHPESRYTPELNSNKWVVKSAPPPDDIYWENLDTNLYFWYLKFIVVNLLLGSTVIMFTTPVYVFTTFAGPKMAKHSAHSHDKKITLNINATVPTDVIPEEIVEHITPLISLIVDTLPTIIVCTLAVVLVSVVAASDVFIGFWTKTRGNLSEMLKTFFFLALMVIILPSLGVTSFSYFFDDVFNVSWSCIFYKENGGLFVNYLITSSLMGTGAELLRLPELLLLLVQVAFAKSKAEIGSIRKSILWEFLIGSCYAWTLLHFAIFTCFSVIYPLVTPVGFIYFCLKHWTDRYNIYFSYAPCKVDKEIHRVAVYIVIFCMIMLQANLLIYVHFYLDTLTVAPRAPISVTEQAVTVPEIRALQIFTLLCCAISTALFIGHISCDIFTDVLFPACQLNPPDESAMDKDTYYQALKDRRLLKHNMNTRYGLPPGPKQQPSSESTTDGTLTASDSYSGEILAENSTRMVHFSETQADKIHSIASFTGSQPNRQRKRPYGHYIPHILRPEFIRLWRNESSLYHVTNINVDPDSISELT